MTFSQKKFKLLIICTFSDQISTQFKQESQKEEEEDQEDREDKKEEKKELGRTHKIILSQYDVSESITDSNDSSFYGQSLEDLSPIKSKEKKKHKKKKMIRYNEDHDIEIEKMNDEVLLKTLNEIGKFAKIHFNNMQQSVESDNLPRFVMFLLKK